MSALVVVVVVEDGVFVTGGEGSQSLVLRLKFDKRVNLCANNGVNCVEIVVKFEL